MHGKAGTGIEKKIPKNCDCGFPLKFYTFRVLVTTPDPDIYEIRMLRMRICWKCKILYAAPKDLAVMETRLIAWEKKLDELLFS